MKKNANKNDVLKVLKSFNAKKALAMSLALTTATVAIPPIDGVLGPVSVYATSSEKDAAFAAGVENGSIKIVGLADRTFTGQAPTFTPTLIYTNDSGKSSYLSTGNDMSVYVDGSNGVDKPGFMDIKITIFPSDAPSLLGASYTYKNYKATGALASTTVTHDSGTDSFEGGVYTPGLKVELLGKNISSDLDTEFSSSYTYSGKTIIASLKPNSGSVYTGSKSVIIDASSVIDLNKATITPTASIDKFDGTKAIEPDFTVTLPVGSATETLTKGTHYTVTYANNTQAGTATATITGAGIFSGTSKEVTFTIENDDSFEGLFTSSSIRVASGISNQSYTGNPISLKTTILFTDPVTKKSSLLTQGTDYNLVYKDSDDAILASPTDPGVITVDIVGAGAYEGNKLEGAGTFNITAILNNTNINDVSIDNQPYAGGTPIEPDIEIKFGETVLTEGEDYTITYTNNTKLGTALANIKGITYSGSVYKTFQIVGASFDDIDVELELEETPEDGYVADGKEHKPGVTVNLTNGGDPSTVVGTLTENTDYTVTYEDNIGVGTATVTVTGKGNYSGELTKTFAIKAYDLTTDSTATLELGTVPTGLKYTGDPDVMKQKPTVTLKTTNGDMVLVEGSDFKYVYSAKAPDGTDYTALEAYDLTKKDYRVSVEGLGSYANADQFASGTAPTADYTIGLDLSNATVDFKDTVTSGGVTGYTFDPTGSTTASLNVTIPDASGAPATLTDVFSESYQNNTNVGEATLRLTAASGYTSTPAMRTLNFNILPYSITNAIDVDDFTALTDDGAALIVIDTSALELEYTGGDATEGKAKYVKVTYEYWDGNAATTKTLELDKDYTIAFEGNNTTLGSTPKVAVTGIGNYSGSNNSITAEIVGSSAVFSADTLSFKGDVPTMTYKGTTLTPATTLKNFLYLGDKYLIPSEFTMDNGDDNENYTVGKDKGSVFVTGAAGYESTDNVDVELNFDVYGDLASTTVELEDGEGDDTDNHEYYYRKETNGYTPTSITVGLGYDGSDGFYNNLTSTTHYTPTITNDKNGATENAIISLSPVTDSYYTGAKVHKYTIMQTPIDGEDLDTATVTYGFANRDADGALTGIIEDHSVTFTGLELEPEVVLYQTNAGGDKILLEEGTDYTLKYDDNTSVSEGEATVTITPKGNFTKDSTDNVTLNFDIEVSDDLFEKAVLGGDAVDSTTANKIIDVAFDGTTDKEYEPAPTLSIEIGGELTALTKGEDADSDGDYYITYEDNAAPGEATITFTGINNYEGSEFDTTFDITCDLSDLELALADADDLVYSKGVAREPELEADSDLLGCTNMGDALKLTYTGSTGYGEASATVGIADTLDNKDYYYFSTPIVLKYNIAPVTLNADDMTFTLNADGKDEDEVAAMDYTGKELKPSITKLTVTGDAMVNGEISENVVVELTLNVDYKIVRYENNIDVASSTADPAPAIIIQGLGGYAGGDAPEVEENFTILPGSDLLSPSNISAIPKQVLTVSEADKVVPVTELEDVVVVTYAGEPLTCYDGTNGDIADYYLVYGDDEVPEDPTSYTPDDDTNATPGIYAGLVTVVGMNNFEGSEAEKGFDIYGDLDQYGTVEIDDNDFTDGAIQFTGDAFTPDITIDYGDIELNTDDFKIDYSNNTNVGTATIAVSAYSTAEYSGTLKGEFEITPLTLESATVVFADSIEDENGDPTGTYGYRSGNEVQPKPTVTIEVTDGDDIELKEGVHYELSYSNNKEMTADGATSDLPTVTITGIGDYAAKITPGENDGDPDVKTNIIDKTFTIVGIELQDSFISKISNQTFAGKDIEPNPMLIAPASVTGASRDTFLTLGTDYEIKEYIRNDRPGLATIVVEGKGNYSGEAEVDFEIWGNLIQAVVTINPDADTSYTGEAVEPEFTVKLFDVDITNLVAGADDDTSTDDVNTTSANPIEDPGTTPEPEVEVEEEVFVYPDAYTTTYSNNVNVGYSSILKINAVSSSYFTGSKTEIFSIGATALTDSNVEFKNMPTDDEFTADGTEKTIEDLVIVYTPGGSSDVPTTDPNSLTSISGTDENTEGIELKEGTDYTVSYFKNIGAGDAEVTITGKGGFSGTVKKTFKINPMASAGGDTDTDDGSGGTPDDGSGGTPELDGGDREDPNVLEQPTYQELVLNAVAGVNANHTFLGKPLELTPSILVTLNGKAVYLQKDTDYTLGYKNNDAPGRSAVWATGIGDYAGLGVTLEFNLVANLLTYSYAEIAEQTLTEGEPVELDKNAITLTYGTHTLPSDAFEITNYINNTKAGTAFATIVPSDKYKSYLTGTRSISFKIAEPPESEESTTEGTTEATE